MVAVSKPRGTPPQPPHTKYVGNEREEPLGDFATRLIRRKAKQLSRRPGFSCSDRPDLEQQLTLVILRRLPDFDERRSHYNAFVTTVVERYAATIIQHRSAEMRSHRRNGGSLNVSVSDDNGHAIELVATICSSQQSLRTGRSERPQEEASDLVRDVSEVVDQMPPQMRKVCDILMRDSKAAAARELGISQGALYGILGRILKRFEKAGMRDYLR